MSKTMAIAVGSDENFRADLFAASHRFLAANPDLEPELAMVVFFTHAMDFMWSIARHGKPKDGKTAEAAFRSVVIAFADMVINGEHYCAGPNVEATAHA